MQALSCDVISFGQIVRHARSVEGLHSEAAGWPHRRCSNQRRRSHRVAGTVGAVKGVELAAEGRHAPMQPRPLSAFCEAPRRERIGRTRAALRAAPAHPRATGLQCCHAPGSQHRRGRTALKSSSWKRSSSSRSQRTLSTTNIRRWYGRLCQRCAWRAESAWRGTRGACVVTGSGVRGLAQDPKVVGGLLSRREARRWSCAATRSALPPRSAR